MLERFKWHLLALLVLGIGIALFYPGGKSPRDIPYRPEAAKPELAPSPTPPAKLEPRIPGRALLRDFPARTEFVRAGQANALVIYGDENKDTARQLCDELQKVTGVALPRMLDTEAAGGRRWTLKDDVKNQNLLLLGNINNNRGILALYAKFLSAESGKFPGSGRYVLRHLAEPFVPMRTAFVIGASDKAGLQQAAARFIEVLRNAQQANDKQNLKSSSNTWALGLPFLEFGDEHGKMPEIKNNTKFLNYTDAAYVFYAGGRAAHCYAWYEPRPVAPAMQAARGFVMQTIASENTDFPAGGHYDWIRNYQALRIIVAHGLLNAAELRGLQEKLLENALANKDAYITSYHGRRDLIMSDRYSGDVLSFDRHEASTVVGQYLLLDYLVNFAQLSDKTKSEIQSEYALFSKIVSDWNRYRVFRGRGCDLGELDDQDFLIDGFIQLGIEDFVDNGILRDMTSFYLCNVNNLWCDAGADFYIGAYRGCHIVSPAGGLAVKAWAFFKRDYSLEKLDEMRFEKAGTYQRGFRDGPPSMCLGQPEPFSLPPRATKPEALACPLLMKSVPEPTGWKTAVSLAGARKPEPQYSQGYNTAAFRDGWTPADACLSIKGYDVPYVRNVNTINSYTEYGAYFLFGGSQSYESWQRSGITVDTAGYTNCDNFAMRTAELSGNNVALFASLCARFNGSSWQRTIIRRKHGCFIVLDDITALQDGDFNVTATWRVLPACAIGADGVLRGAADNGAHFAIIPDQPYPGELTRPAVDGVSRPTFYRQSCTRSLKKGESVSFHNAIASAKKGAPIEVKVERRDDRTVLVRQGAWNVALAGTRHLPGGAVLPSGGCAAFYLDRDTWMLGGVKLVGLRERELLRADNPVDVIVDFAGGKAKLTVHDSAAQVRVSQELGSGGESKEFAPGEYAFDLKLAGITNFDAIVSALPRTAPPAVAANKKSEYPAISGWEETWSAVVQAPPPIVIRPVGVAADQAPSAMAAHNLHDGVFATSSLPSATWRIPALTITLEQGAPVQKVTGLRIDGGFGGIQVEELDQAGNASMLKFTETEETCFAGYSASRVGSDMYKVRRLDFTSGSPVIRLRLAAKDKDNQALSVSEIQLLGLPAKDEVWGRLKIEQFSKGANPILLCRTGTYADTVEQGGALQAFALDGKPLWKHGEPAPSQYRGKYWLTGDMDSDGDKELVTYSDDTVLRIYEADGKLAQAVDLHAWEESNQGKGNYERVLGNSYLGGKSLALWPKRPDGSSDMLVFGHVHHHQVQTRPEVLVQRRDRVPDIDCAFAASLTVEGWTGPGKQNLTGVAPYDNVVVLWEAQGAGKAPLVMARHALDPLLGYQLSANNQLPAFVECLKVSKPEGVAAVTPRGVQFFGKPDIKPGWAQGGMAPITAANVISMGGDRPDRIIIGRENGRVLLYDAASGKLLGEKLLAGAIRGIAACQSGALVVGAAQGLFVLKADLGIVGFRPCSIEDLAVAETGNKIFVYILSPDGKLTASRL